MIEPPVRNDTHEDGAVRETARADRIGAVVAVRVLIIDGEINGTSRHRQAEGGGEEDKTGGAPSPGEGAGKRRDFNQGTHMSGDRAKRPLPGVVSGLNVRMT